MNCDKRIFIDGKLTNYKSLADVELKEKVFYKIVVIYDNENKES